MSIWGNPAFKTNNEWIQNFWTWIKNKTEYLDLRSKTIENNVELICDILNKNYRFDGKRKFGIHVAGYMNIESGENQARLYHITNANLNGSAKKEFEAQLDWKCTSEDLGYKLISGLYQSLPGIQEFMNRSFKSSSLEIYNNLSKREEYFTKEEKNHNLLQEKYLELDFLSAKMIQLVLESHNYVSLVGQPFYVLVFSRNGIEIIKKMSIDNLENYDFIYL